MSLRRLASASALAAVLSLTGASPALAGHYAEKAWPGGATVTRAAPVYFIHGSDLGPFSGDPNNDCTGTWGDTSTGMIGRFYAWGHSGPFIKTKYYFADTNCTRDLGNYGNHSTHYATSDGVSGHRSDGGHSRDTSIRHLAYHLAWDIADRNRYSNVNVVAHSMGGLILRYALMKTAQGHPDFPASMMVKDAITLGTPHEGSGAADLCTSIQCREMRNGSPLLQEMAASGQNPQGLYGTDWTLVGSENDGVVSQGSATGMQSQHKVIYGGGRGHSDYYKDTSSSLDASVKWDEGWDGHGYMYWDFAPHVVKWADRAAATWTW